MRALRNVLVLAVALASLPPAGCGSTQRASSEDLMGEIRFYLEGVRWQRYQDAVARLPPERREAFLDEREELDEDLRIDDYEIERVKVSADGRAAVVQVKYTWHLNSVGLVRTTVSELAWQRHGKHWLVMAEVRKRGHEMPGLAEPEEPEEPVAPDEGDLPDEDDADGPDEGEDP
jgi:hypothetical protein